jgi:hypothetical protein
LPQNGNNAAGSFSSEGSSRLWLETGAPFFPALGFLSTGKTLFALWRLGQPRGLEEKTPDAGKLACMESEVPVNLHNLPLTVSPFSLRPTEIQCF